MLQYPFLSKWWCGFALWLQLYFPTSPPHHSARRIISLHNMESNTICCLSAQAPRDSLAKSCEQWRGEKEEGEDELWLARLWLVCRDSLIQLKTWWIVSHIPGFSLVRLTLLSFWVAATIFLGLAILLCISILLLSNLHALAGIYHNCQPLIFDDSSIAIYCSTEGCSLDSLRRPVIFSPVKIK